MASLGTGPEINIKPRMPDIWEERLWTPGSAYLSIGISLVSLTGQHCSLTGYQFHRAQKLSSLLQP